MTPLLSRTINVDRISAYIKEAIEANAGEIQNQVSLEEFERVTPAIVRMIRIHFLRKMNAEDEARMVEKYSNGIKRCYRKILQENKRIIISLHLNFLILFNHLENEAKEMGDTTFEKMWSALAHDFIEISLSENEAVRIALRQ